MTTSICSAFSFQPKAQSPQAHTYATVPAASVRWPQLEYFEFFFNHNVSLTVPPRSKSPVLFRYHLPGTGDVSSEKKIDLQW